MFWCRRGLYLWFGELKYFEIPRMKLNLSALCLGTASYGSAIPPKVSFQLMDAFVTRGGNFLDSAHIYASWAPNGEGGSERTIGEWVAANGNRHEILIGTKGSTLEKETGHAPMFDPDFVARELNESLARLQADYVDIYWLHRDNPDLPVSEILGVFQPFVDSRVIHSLAVSNWTVPRIREAIACAKASDLPQIRASQIGWSLARTSGKVIGDKTMLFMDDTTHAFHVESNFPQVAYASQANGFFAGKGDRLLRDPGSTDELLAAHRKRYGKEENFRRLARAKKLAERRDTSANRIALAYLLCQPFPSSAIIGPRTPDQLSDSLGAVDLRLTPEEICGLT
jgi:aryl-alcohol dehydrogenase-like predicted oxidoreductase